MAFHVPNAFRVKRGPLSSDDSYGNNGAFEIIWKRKSVGPKLNVLCIASDQDGWEHVSISLNKPRCPYWNEMCRVKDIFWDDEDAVIQIHPPRSEYVDNHPYALHLWRKADTNNFYEPPPSWMVGLLTEKINA